MEKCLLDLLQQEKNCVTLINQSEDRVSILKDEIERVKKVYEPSETRDCDIAATQARIAQEENKAAQERSHLYDIRDEMRDYFKDLLN